MSFLAHTSLTPSVKFSKYYYQFNLPDYKKYPSDRQKMKGYVMHNIQMFC